MEEFIIYRTNDLNLRFKGELLAETKKEETLEIDHKTMTSTKVEKHYRIFKTQKNNYVCAIKKQFKPIGEETIFARVCKTTNQVYSYFLEVEGYYNIAIKELFYKAGLELFNDVE